MASYFLNHSLEEWLQAAEKGDAFCQNNLGVLYKNGGTGVPPDNVEAAKWYRMAAEQGDATAQSNLGGMYAKGLGLPQDFVLAVKWYRQAAEQGHANAQFNLGYRYYTGEGLIQDYVQAHMWANLAAAQNIVVAKTLRDGIAQKMTPSQLAEAQRLAREWLEEHGE